jgi:hypothetical protein
MSGKSRREKSKISSPLTGEDKGGGEKIKGNSTI